MRLREQPYARGDDLLRIGALIRRAFAQAPYWNAWSFARFDIWAQRRIADECVHGYGDWQQGIRLWEDETGALIGAVTFPGNAAHRKDPNVAALFLHPEHRELAGTMLTWMEDHHGAMNIQDAVLRVETTESNVFMEHLLQSRGYAKTEAHMICREKRLDGTPMEQVTPSPGFSIKRIETLEDLKLFHEAVRVVFNFQDSVDVYRIVQQAPSFVPELGLMMLFEEREVASFCTVWVDRQNGVAEFESVGTIPSFRKRGLGVALMAEAHNRLRLRGCRTATVESWSESPAANALYEAVGLLPATRMYEWQKQQP